MLVEIFYQLILRVKYVFGSSVKFGISSFSKLLTNLVIHL